MLFCILPCPIHLLENEESDEISSFDTDVSQTNISDTRRPPGVRLSDFDIARVVGTTGSVSDRAERVGVSPSTVYRIDHRLHELGTPFFSNNQSLRIALGPRERFLMCWYKFVFQDATREECVEILQIVYNAKVSVSTVSRELHELGFTRKKITHYSPFLDEDDRIKFWVNPPTNAIRPGVRGVIFTDYVDIDESGYYASDANPLMGDSMEGTPCRQPGGGARTMPHYSLLIAVDARVGIVKKLMYPKGTTNETFYSFVQFLLIPALAGTGRRVITMDRLNSHFGVKELLEEAGHIVIFRPLHSPTFGPVEWVFHYIELYLVHERHEVNEGTLKRYIENACDTITKLDIIGYMSEAHFWVPGHSYKPYRGER